MPLEATQHTPDGAKAFAAFFVKTIDWGYATTSGAYIRHYASPSCNACTGFARYIDSVQTKHNHFIGGRFSIAATTALPSRNGSGTYTSLVPISTTALEEVTRSGKFVQGFAAHHGEKFEVTLSWRASWHVSDLRIEV